MKAFAAEIKRKYAVPPTMLRLLIAALIAGMAALQLFSAYKRFPGLQTDFNIAWLGAKALLEGADPYSVVGPGKEYDFRWPATYPATAFLLVSPLAFLSEHQASIVFIFVSTFALVFGMTRTGWWLLPMLASEAFFSAVNLGQWSIIMTAGLFLPWLQALAVAKPHTGLSIIAGAPSLTGIRAAVGGGALLLIVSLILLPTWPLGWMQVVKINLSQMSPPLLAFGGPLVLLALFRWRRWESWLILSMAVLPQNWGWYHTLPLLATGRGWKEAVALSAASTVGIMLGAAYLPATPRNFGGVMIAAAYMPPVLLLLRRPNLYEPLGASQRVPSLRPQHSDG